LTADAAIGKLTDSTTDDGNGMPSNGPSSPQQATARITRNHQSNKKKKNIQGIFQREKLIREYFKLIYIKLGSEEKMLNDSER
jgi:hypothetical protein